MLVEALAALALSALVMVALLSFTGIMRRSADRAAARVEVLEVMGRTLTTISGELRNASRLRWAAEPLPADAETPAPSATALPSARRSAGDEETQDSDRTEQGRGRSERQERRAFIFSGAPDRVLFALTPRQATGLRAPVVVAYQIDPSGAVLRAEGALSTAATGPGMVKLGPVARIDPGPERLRFAFVDRQPNGGEVVVDAWSETKRMPAAIRIDRTDPKTGVVLGSIRTPLLLDGEPGCVDPEKTFCSRVERTDGANRDRRRQPQAAGPSGEQE